MTDRAFLGGSDATAPATASASTAHYFVLNGRTGLGSGVAASTTEANAQIKLRACTLRNWLIQVTTNGRSTATTFKVRVNGADSALSITVGAGLTGTFMDTSNTASVADGDLVCGVCTTGTGTGPLALVSSALELEVASGAFSHVGFGLAGVGINVTSASTTRFLGPGCNDQAGVESRLQVRAPETATLSRLQCYVASNARTTSCTFLTRKNGANGGQSVVIGAGLTGFFEDTSGTDSLVAGDLWCFGLTTGTGTETINLRHGSVKRAGSQGTSNWAVTLFGNTLGAGVTGYCPATGNASGFGATESTQQTIVPFAGRVSKGGIVVSANASTADATFVMRLNSADTAVSVSVGAGLTGAFADTTNSFAVARGDLVAWKASGAATGAITLGGLSSLLTATIIGAAAITEAGDTVSAASAVAIAGALAASEASDAVAATGALPVAGALAATEADDTLSAAGAVAIAAAVAALEADDTFAAAARLAIAGVLNLTEANDNAAAETVGGAMGPPMATLRGRPSYGSLTGVTARDLG